MATIKDIAKLAGVSHGTVSNVLNSRGNVSVVKIDAVMAAAERLGYRANSQAKQLRAGSAKAIALVVPDIASERNYLLYNGLNRFLMDQGYTLDLFCTYDRDEIEKKQLDTIATRQYTGIVAISSFISVTCYYRTLNIPSEKIIFVFRRSKNAESFYDIDITEATEKLIKQLKIKNYSRVALFTDHPSCSIATALYQKLQSDLPTLSIRHISSLSAENHKAAFALLNDVCTEAVICSDYDKVKFVKNAFYLGSNEAPPLIYTFAGEELCLESDLYCYAINYQESGRKIAQYLTQHPAVSHFARTGDQ